MSSWLHTLPRPRWQHGAHWPTIEPPYCIVWDMLDVVRGAVQHAKRPLPASWSFTPVEESNRRMVRHLVGSGPRVPRRRRSRRAAVDQPSTTLGLPPRHRRPALHPCSRGMSQSLAAATSSTTSVASPGTDPTMRSTGTAASRLRLALDDLVRHRLCGRRRRLARDDELADPGCAARPVQHLSALGSAQWWLGGPADRCQAATLTARSPRRGRRHVTWPST